MKERIDVNKTSGLYKCSMYHRWYFLEINFRFQSNVCDGCHDLTQKAISFNVVVIVSFEENNYRINVLVYE